MFTVRVNFQSD